MLGRNVFSYCLPDQPAIGFIKGDKTYGYFDFTIHGIWVLVWDARVGA